MKDTDLYSRILGLTEPWFVEAVELSTADGRVNGRREDETTLASTMAPSRANNPRRSS